MAITWGCRSIVSTTHLNKPSYRLVKMNGEIDHDMDSIIGIHREDMTNQMSKVIGISEEVLESRRPESNLMRLVSTAVYSETNRACRELGIEPPIACILNAGGIRTSMPKGVLTVRNVFEVSPFENGAVVIKVSGSVLIKACQHIVKRGGEPVDNIEMKMTRDHRLISAQIDGKPIVADSTYWIATNSYLAEGGDGFEMFKKCEMHDTGITIRDMMINYIICTSKKGQKLKDPGNQRIYIVEE